uniref:Cadherin domain-containing protein n=1 Tax=Knipowitschia caucasica TaxID=637954 RepID=A0AAV2JX26_KNICA
MHTLNIEVWNPTTDPRFSHMGPFRDSTSLQVIVGDVDEPPLFSMDFYILDVYENSPAGTQVGTVSAQDPDTTNSQMRYFIEKEEGRAMFFTIGVNSGLIRTNQALDREETAWHNLTVMAAEVDTVEAVRDCFESALWDELCDPHGQDIHGMTECITGYINFCFQNTSVTRNLLCFANNKPWINSDIKTLLKAKRHAFRSGNEEELRDVQRNLRTSVRETKARYRGQMEAQLSKQNIKDNPRMMSYVQVTIQVLDINDNVPSVAGSNSAIIACDNTRVGQVIQTLRAADRDNFANGQFSFWIPPELQANPNFTVRDNGDSTAGLVSRRREGFSGQRDSSFSLVLVVSDGGEPPLSSTATLHIRVCACERNRGRYGANVCQAQAFLSSAGISTGAFVAILLCTLILLATVMLFTQLHLKKTSKDKLILSEEDIRENVVTYDDEGGGEEDTEAFDITALRNPKVSERYPKLQSYYDRSTYKDTETDSEEEIVIVQRKRDYFGAYSPESAPSWFASGCVQRDVSRSEPSLLLDGHDVVRQVLQRKVSQANRETRGPPYDSLQTYAYEGRGSLAGSVSSLGLTQDSFPELSCTDLEEWGPNQLILGLIIGDQDSTDS